MFSSETKVLIVDDMLTMRKIVRKTVFDLGLKNTVEAPDGAAAWAEVEKTFSTNTPFQLIISDWNMPVLTGIELLKKVRSNEKTRNVPFVFLTAESEKNQILEAMKLGVTTYILKPFTPATFKEKLEIAYQSSLKST